MLKIGDFSKLSRISIRMLRYYDQLGLLTPQSTDPFTGYRYYTAEQLIPAGRIHALREMGFGLAAIGEMLRCGSDPQALAGRMAAQRAALQAQADALERQILLLDTAMEQLRKDETAMNYNVSLKTLPERQVASVRMVLPHYSEEGRLWHTMMAETVGMHMAYGDPRIACAVFHDKEYKDQDVDVEVQMTVRGPYPDTEHVRFKTEPPVQFASATFRGRVRSDRRRQRRRGRLGAGQRLCLRRADVQHLPRRPQRYRRPQGLCDRGLLPRAQAVTAGRIK